MTLITFTPACRDSAAKIIECRCENGVAAYLVNEVELHRIYTTDEKRIKAHWNGFVGYHRQPSPKR